ncbi:hypothetical protein CDCA_CDCA01G0202 [Cyanidium caldarium]|uniref:Cytosol aminopeptidase domain-containing protein n=1 Tax=Cyanidium caldarium TaxID=2771 RepID=A0AAV9IP98_CYACA|nr:hypothetical protein CDCA_CDCA01G0202 [Cyanidium caldarium]
MAFLDALGVGVSSWSWARRALQGRFRWGGRASSATAWPLGRRRLSIRPGVRATTPWQPRAPSSPPAVATQLRMSVSTRVRPPSERQPLPVVRAETLSGTLQEYEGDAVFVALFTDDVSSPSQTSGNSASATDNSATTATLSPRLTASLGEALAAATAQLLADVEFKPKKGASVVTRFTAVPGVGGSATPAGARIRPRRLALFCLGKEDELNADALNKFANFVAANVKLDKRRGERVGVYVPSIESIDRGGGQGLSARLASQRLTEGILLAAFADDRFRTTSASADSDNGDGAAIAPSPSAPPRPEPSTVQLFGADAEGVRRGACVAEGVILTKELVNAPANVATPQFFADTAADIARNANGTVRCTVLEREDCERLGMGAYLGVAQGSDLPPKFIHLTYTSPENDAAGERKRVCLIGKGVTHDTGGYNLKTAGSMIELMKFDCGGAAACLGTMKAVAALAPPGLELTVVAACCENMISGKAYHPGDILTASNGKTIEVLNTDAEGRLTLADALVYVQRNVKPIHAMVDVATLTGACVVALGNEYSGMWSSHDALAQHIDGASKAVGERVWRMPLAPEYREGLQGKVSDLKNIGGGRFGGAITAALFLQEFVDKQVPWAHLDIAGTVWNDKGSGATGTPTRTLIELVHRVLEA